MSFDDPAVRGLLELEGLHEWRPGRTTGSRSSRRRPARALRRRRAARRSGVPPVTTTPAVVDLGPLGLDGGGHVLVKLTLTSGAPKRRGGRRRQPPGARRAPPRLVHRHRPPLRGPHPRRRAHGAPRAPRRLSRGPLGGGRASGHSRAVRWPTWPTPPGASRHRGVWVEAGGPTPRFALDHKDDLWADDKRPASRTTRSPASGTPPRSSRGTRHATTRTPSSRPSCR